VGVLILGIETATARVGCAIGGHEGVLALFEVTRGRRHAEVLVPAIQAALERAEVGIDEIGCVAVDVGPGLFTGMRVGIATAKSLAHALRVPTIGISSLDLLAFPLRHSRRTIVAVIDARRGEVYSARYRAVPGGVQRLSEPVVGSADDLAADVEAAGEEVLFVGDGALRYRDVLGKVRRCEVADPWLAHPSAGALVQLAHARALREEWVNHWELEPLYLRKPDAEINWSTREADR
jgi:tRNA threonylcarbamoyladenosine biosynthesis protein TsaB